MSIIIWSHNTTKSSAIETIINEIEKLGYKKYIIYNNDEIKACAGIMNCFINAKCIFTEEKIFLEACSGIFKDKVIEKCCALLQEKFPGGECK